MTATQGELVKWAEGRFPVVAIAAQQMAIIARGLADTLQEIGVASKRQKLTSEIGELSSWVRLYRTHRKIWDVVGGLMPSGAYSAELIAEELLVDHPELEALPTSAAEMQALVTERFVFSPEFQERISAAYELTLREHLSNPDWPQPDSDEMQLPPELVFMFLVTLPCLGEFGIHPGFLFKRARQGDFEAIRDLIGLDPRIVADPRILRHVIGIQEGTNKARKRALEKAQRGRPPKVTRRNVKYLLAGYVSNLAEDLDDVFRQGEEFVRSMDAESRLPRSKLTAPDFRALFDAAARDLGEDDFIDLDLPDSDDTLRREILRAKKFWRKHTPGQN